MPVEAPDAPARCTVYWKIADAWDRPFFQPARPLFFDVVVGS